MAIFQVDIGVELPLPFCPRLTEKWLEKKNVVGHSTQPVHQDLEARPPLRPINFASFAASSRIDKGP